MSAQASTGVLTPVAVQTSAYGAAAGQFVPVSTASGAVTVTLPAAPADLSVVVVKMVAQASTNTVTVAAAGRDVFNAAGGSTSLTLTLLNQGVLLQYYAAASIWYVLSDDLALAQLDARYPANPMSTLGDTVYGGASGALTRLAGDTSNTRKFLREQSSGGVAAAPVWDTLVAGDVPTLNQNTTGTAANVTGTVAIGNGGTGQTTQQAAIDALAGAQTSAQYLRGNGTHVQMSAIQAGDVPTLNQNTTGTASNITGALSGVPVPTGSVAMNSQKITGLANGSAATDAAAFGQIPVIDSTAADIAPLNSGTAGVAGSTGKTADAGHKHDTHMWLPGDHNLLTWSADPANAASPRAATGAGILQVIALKLLAQVSVTNIVMYVATAGGTLTSGQCFASLYASAAGAVIGTSADQSGTWNSTGLKTMALASGPFNAGPGIVYVAWWYNGTTSPSFAGGDNATAKINVGLAAAASRFGVANTSVTTSAPGTLGAITASTAAGWWAALS